MAILRNVDVAKRYQVTPATVGNWIELAKSNRLALDLTTLNGRVFLEDTPKNHQEFIRLKEQGAKFRAKHYSKIVIKPDPRIYKVFTEEQLISLFVNISYYNLIPVKFSYTDVGAQYYELGFKESLNNPLSGPFVESNLVNAHFKGIIDRFQNGEKINILEMGHDWSTFAIKDAVSQMVTNNSLNNYISVGMSEDMYAIRARSMQNWFGIGAKKYIADIEESVIRNILFKERSEENVINICLLLQSSITNIRNISALLENLSESLGAKDYLLISTVLTDEEGSDRVVNKPGQNIMNRHSWLLDLLGLSEHISVEYYSYDPIKRMRTSYFILNRDIEIEFEIGQKKYPLKLERDRKITFFISYRYTLQELLNYFRAANLSVEQYNSYNDERGALFFIKNRNINRYD